MKGSSSRKRVPFEFPPDFTTNRDSMHLLLFRRGVSHSPSKFLFHAALPPVPSPDRRTARRPLSRPRSTDRQTDRPQTGCVVYRGTLGRARGATQPQWQPPMRTRASLCPMDGNSNIIVVLQKRRSRPTDRVRVRRQFHGQRLHSIETCVITLSPTDWLTAHSLTRTTHNVPTVSSTLGGRGRGRTPG